MRGFNLSGVSLGDAAIRSFLKASVDAQVIPNTWRGIFVEHLVAVVLGADYRATDFWSSWDIEHVSGFRIEVKQSAALQTWTKAERETSAADPSFDIKERKGYWEGDDWVEKPGRHAALYVFAWHPIQDPATADHRDADQWLFYLARTEDLPATQRVRLKWLRERCGEVAIGALAAEVEGIRKHLGVLRDG